jgi:DNA-binding NtrC family response regulator
MDESFRVLIVDDEDDLLSTLVERLEFRGIRTVGVQTGEQALAKIAKQDFDVVVQDVKLKGEDGVEVMKNIKQIRPNLPVILLTGHMSQESSREGLEAGAIDYVLKPINLEDLIVKMQEAIATSRRGESR